jgi:hypothetical protein
MKHLRRFNESINLDFIKGTYTINPDGSYDVEGDVDLSDRDLTELPIKFNKVSGYFYCYNNKLTSLKGCPKIVGGDFNCYNNQLTSLIGSPEKVGSYFDCHDNKLTSLKGCPKEVGGKFDCSFNNLTNFKGFNCKISNKLYCDNNHIKEIYKLCPTKKFINALNEYSVIRGDKVLLNRLEDALYQAEADDIDISKLKFKNYIIV